jgi:hypothetical protein
MLTVSQRAGKAFLEQGAADAKSTRKPERRIDERAIIASSPTLVQPAIRMVVIRVWPDGDSPHIEIMPVLAIESRLIDSFSMVTHQGDSRQPRSLRTADDLEAAGFRFQSRQIQTGVLYIDPGSGDALTSSTDEFFESQISADHRIVPCPWPPSEDEERLAPIIEEMAHGLRGAA